MTTFVVRKKTMTYGVILPSPDGWGIGQVQDTWYAVLEMHDGKEVMQRGSYKHRSSAYRAAKQWRCWNEERQQRSQQK